MTDEDSYSDNDADAIESAQLDLIEEIIADKRRLDEDKADTEGTILHINTRNSIISHFASCYKSGVFPKKGSVNEIDMNAVQRADRWEVAPKAEAFIEYINDTAIENTKMNELWTKYQLWPEDNLIDRWDIHIFVDVKYGNENDEKLKKMEEELKKTDKLIEEKCSKIACLDLFDNEESEVIELLKKVDDINLTACSNCLQECVWLQRKIWSKHTNYSIQRNKVFENLILQFDIEPVWLDEDDEEMVIDWEAPNRLYALLIKHYEWSHLSDIHSTDEMAVCGHIRNHYDDIGAMDMIKDLVLCYFTKWISWETMSMEREMTENTSAESDSDASSGSFNSSE